MFIYATGGINGNWNNFFNNIENKIKETSIKPNVILNTGSLGIFPNKVTRTFKKFNKVNEFQELYKYSKSLNYPTFFVPGRHEDHYWMCKAYSKGQLEILPNLYWMVSGVKFPIGPLNILGLGKVYSPITYFNQINNKAQLNHYTKAQVERCCSQGVVDILLTHQAGKGSYFNNIVSESEGINEICTSITPKLHIHGHYNTSKIYFNNNIRTISLAYNEIKIIKFNKISKEFEIL